MKNNVEIVPATHKGQSVILIKFPFNTALINKIKALPGSRWSCSLTAWYVPDNMHYRERFGLPLVKTSKETLAKISAANRAQFIELKNTLILKGYSVNTIRTYGLEFAQLLYILKELDVTTLSAEKLRGYFVYCANTLKLSENQLHSRFNAIKFYFENVLHREKLFFDIPRPKKHLLLPKVISADEIKRLLNRTVNIKHNTMLKLCYGMGLRVSEIVNIKLCDVDSSRMQVFIERGKGKKDRYVNLPESILTQLRQYYLEYKPKIYLFEGQYGGRYSIRSAQKVFKDALKRASINKNIGIHSLRHSYATHLLETGTDITYIQQLLGHNNIKTTLLYTHVSMQDIKKVKSPLDNF